MNRYIIKFDKKEDMLELENQFSFLESFKSKIYLNHYIYNNDEESIEEYFLFYQSFDILIEDFLNKCIHQNDSKAISNEIYENIIKVNDLSENILDDIERKCSNTIYITNFPKNYTSDNLIKLISCLPENMNSIIPMIERLPCVFKIVFNNMEICKNWIKSILCFIPRIHFSFENLNMSAETNCIQVPVIHFFDLPKSIATIEYFIELMKNDLGDFKMYEQNENKLSFNISYQTNDETWDVIDQLNFQPFDGKEIRVNHFIDTKHLHEMSKFNIKVTKYEGSMNSFDIYENFQQFGSIYSIYNSNPSIDNYEESENDSNQKVEHSNLENDFFCVQYYLKENAIDAITKAPDILNMKNMVLTTKEAGIVVYNFENNITEEKVKLVFPCATKIMVKKSNDKNSRPYVFVNFICQEDCDEAIEICKKTYSDHLRLTCVSQAMTKKQAFIERRKEEEKFQQKYTVFIQGIPTNIIAEEIIQKCAKYGDIDSVVLIDMKKKKSKNVAKISFNSEQAYMNALNSNIVLNNVKIKLKKYDPQMKKK